MSRYAIGPYVDPRPILRTGSAETDDAATDDMDWLLIVEALAHFVGAIALALPIGWERERTSCSAGLRTFPFVVAASCAYVLVGRASTYAAM